MKDKNVIPAREFLSRFAGCLVANAIVTANGEYADRQFPNWRVVPHGRCCAAMTYVTITKKWWHIRSTATFGTPNGEKASALLSRGEVALLREMIEEADMAAEMAIKNQWSIVDL